MSYDLAYIRCSKCCLLLFAVQLSYFSGRRSSHFPKLFNVPHWLRENQERHRRIGDVLVVNKYGIQIKLNMKGPQHRAWSRRCTALSRWPINVVNIFARGRYTAQEIILPVYRLCWDSVRFPGSLHMYLRTIVRNNGHITSSSAMAEKPRDTWRDFKRVGHFGAKF